MELKPTQRFQDQRPRLDGLGNRVVDDKNPFATSGRGIGKREGGLAGPFGAAGPMVKRRRFAADTLGATPPRDGPFGPAAQDVALVNPPRTRSRRSRNPKLGLPPLRGG